MQDRRVHRVLWEHLEVLVSKDFKVVRVQKVHRVTQDYLVRVVL